MNSLAQFVPVFAIAGFTIAVISNLVLVLGRRPEFEVKDVLMSGHLKKEDRKRMFKESTLRVAIPLGYLGIGLFLLAILLVVAGTVRQSFGI